MSRLGLIKLKCIKVKVKWMEIWNRNENTIKTKLGIQIRWNANGMEDIYGGN